MTDASFISSRDGTAEPSALPMKTRLLAAATEVFCQRGYHAARVSDIVTRAGVAQGTFYLHFKSKKAIFLELVDGFFGHLLTATLGRHPAEELAGPDDIVRQLRAMWRTILTCCRMEPGLTSLALRESDALGPVYRSHVAQHYERVVDATVAYLREAARRRIIRPSAPELTAWAILGMVERAVHYAVFVAPEADLDELVGDLVRPELGGLMAVPAALD